MKRYWSCLLVLVLANASCSESPEDGDRGPSGDAGEQEGQDASASSGDAGGGGTEIPDDGAGFFRYSGTVNGKAISRNCTVKSGNAALQDPEAVGVIVAGTQLNIGCPPTAGALIAAGGAYVIIKEFEDRSGDFTITVPSGGGVGVGMEFEYREPSAEGGQAIFQSSKNLTSMTLKANYDPSTRVMKGTLEAEWGAPGSNKEYGPATLSVAFSAEAPSLK